MGKGRGQGTREKEWSKERKGGKEGKERERGRESKTRDEFGALMKGSKV